MKKFSRLLPRYNYTGQFSIENLFPGIRGQSIGSNLSTIDFSGVTSFLTPPSSSLSPATVVVATTSSGLKADYYTSGANDDIQINAAIASLPSTGGSIYIKAGTYTIRNKIIIPSFTGSFKMYGDGWSTILTAKNSLNDHLISFAPTSGHSMFGCEIMYMKLAGNGANQSAGNIIYALGAVHCLFDHLWINQPYASGIYLYQDGNGGTGHHNRVTNCLFDQGNQSASGDGIGLKIEASDENFISNCDFESNGRVGGSNPFQIFDMSGIQQITSCVFVGGACGVKIQGDRTSVVNCAFDGINQDHNIRVNGNEATIVGNKFFTVGFGSGSPLYDGIIIDNSQYATVVGNTFTSDNSGGRSAVNLAFGSSNCVIVGNAAYGQGNGWGTGVIIPGSGTYNEIANNGYYTRNVHTGTVTTSGIATPGSISLSQITGTLTAATYYYRVTATNDAGETLASVEQFIVLGVTAGVQISWGAVNGATGYKVYGRTTGAEQLIGTIKLVGLTTFNDTGSVTPSGALPTRNSTGDVTLVSDGNGQLILGDGANIKAGTTTGTQIGTVGGASGQKLAFWAKTPIVQPLLATGAAHTVDDVITVLQNLGLVRQS